MLHWNLLGKNCILPTLRSIRAAVLPGFRRFPRVICLSGQISHLAVQPRLQKYSASPPTQIVDFHVFQKPSSQ